MIAQDATRSALRAADVQLDSVYDIALSGGVLMWPIALCSVVALTFIVERAIRLREAELGSTSYARAVIDALAAGGPARALEACARAELPLGRILRTGLARAERPPLEREKAVEDAGARELRRLNARLRPLAVVGVLAPLLGFLGTVFGMIQAFIDIALEDGLGRPELLAAGISQALVTTAAGLCVAIPAQAAYFWFRARVERFARRAEDHYLELDETLARLPAAAAAAGAAS
jgi:biopolymer transport protein ExbB